MQEKIVDSNVNQKQTAKGCLMLIVLLILIAFALYSCVYGFGPQPPDDFELKVDAQLIVKDYLVAPASAKFGYDYGIQKISDYEYLVSSFVDSQNAYGAMIRSKFTVVIIYNKDWSKHSAKSVMIDGVQLK